MAAALATQSSRILDAVQILLTGGGQPPKNPSDSEKRRYLCYDALNDKYVTCIEIKKEGCGCGASLSQKQVKVDSTLPRAFDALVLSYKLKQPVLITSPPAPPN